jgi:nucleotide-binding universal stress UspA family protein
MTAALRTRQETGSIGRAAGFASIVVALDLEASGDRALPVVRALAERSGVPVELFTVSSPNLAEEVDTFELQRRATDLGLSRYATAILHDADPATAIVRHVEDRGDALLVMATSAKRPITGLFLGSVSEDVLSLIDRPVLLVGPRVVDPSLDKPTLVACVDSTDIGEAAVPAIADWTRTFAGTEICVAEVVAPGSSGSPVDGHESSHVKSFARRLAGYGVVASWEVLHGAGQPDVAITDFAERVTDPILVATSVRWTDGRLHWHSTTRRLVQRSIWPVLVVPAGARRQPGTANGRGERAQA